MALFTSSGVGFDDASAFELIDSLSSARKSFDSFFFVSEFHGVLNLADAGTGDALGLGVPLTG